MKKIIILVVLLLLLITIIPTNVNGEYIENIDIPSEVNSGETFTVSFDVSYMAGGEVYAGIGLYDTENNPIKDDDGYVMGVHIMKDTFVISETPLKRNVKCLINDQSEGTYKLKIVIYDANTNEGLIGGSKITETFELVKDGDSDSSSSCGSIILVIPIIIGLMMIVIKRRY